jgi:transcription antitermination factor NusG
LDFYSTETAHKYASLNRRKLTDEEREARDNAKRLERQFPNPLRPIPSGLTWYALETAPHKEAKVCHFLEPHTFALVPLETREKRSTSAKRGGKNRTRKSYQVPVIPRLVFAGFLGPPNWLQVLSLSHIRGILGTGMSRTPVTIPEAEIRRIAKNTERLKELGKGPLKTGFAKLLVGVLEGHTVEVLSIDDLTGVAMTKQRWFGSERVVSAKIDDLENVTPK